MLSEHAAAIHALQDVSALLYERGWAFGTSGNYSVVLDRSPLRLLVTASGKDKRRLADGDFVVVDAEGAPIPGRSEKPSAETLLHTTLAGAIDGVGAILHVHTIWNTVLSDFHFERGFFALSGYEMLKGLAEINTHACEVRVAIFDNTQDIPALAAQVQAKLADDATSLRHAFLIRGHGLYTWGRDLREARRHVEILEFLFEVTGRRLSLDAAPRNFVPDSFR
jgi:methylthioribulose-1-phosphate dehydratase